MASLNNAYDISQKSTLLIVLFINPHMLSCNFVWEIKWGYSSPVLSAVKKPWLDSVETRVLSDKLSQTHFIPGAWKTEIRVLTLLQDEA